MKDKQEIRRGARLGWWCLAFFAAAVLLVASFYLDAGAQAAMNAYQNEGLRQIMKAVSRWGDWPEHIVAGLIALAVAFWRGSRKWMRIFAAMIIACALAGVATRVVKISAGRARPNVQTEAKWNGPRLSARYNAFPSGHTAASTAFFAALAFISWRVGLGFLAIPLLIAFSRMYIAAHYLSDVVAAALIGIAAAYVVVHWRPLAIENRNSKIEN